MNEICASCEFRKFCAMSNIVNGCSRYKEDTTTNEQWIRRATTEELAEFLANTFDLCGAGCHHCFLAKICLTKAKNGNCLSQEQMIEEWLKQPHT